MKLSFKNGEELRQFRQTKIESLSLAACHTKNVKRSSSGYNERTLETTLNPHKEIKNIGKKKTT